MKFIIAFFVAVLAIGGIYLYENRELPVVVEVGGQVPTSESTEKKEEIVNVTPKPPVTRPAEEEPKKDLETVVNEESDIKSADIYLLVNDEREKEGLVLLKRNPVLDKAAQAKLKDMLDNDYFAHVTPDGRQPWWFVTEAGYAYVSAGENLARYFRTSEGTVKAWMKSDSHKANILKATFTETGIAVSGSYVVQMFGSPR